MSTRGESQGNKTQGLYQRVGRAGTMPPQIKFILTRAARNWKNNCCFDKQYRRPSPLGRKDSSPGIIAETPETEIQVERQGARHPVPPKVKFEPPSLVFDEEHGNTGPKQARQGTGRPIEVVKFEGRRLEPSQEVFEQSLESQSEENTEPISRPRKSVNATESDWQTEINPRGIVTSTSPAITLHDGAHASSRRNLEPSEGTIGVELHGPVGCNAAPWPEGGRKQDARGDKARRATLTAPKRKARGSLRKGQTELTAQELNVVGRCLAVEMRTSSGPNTARKSKKVDRAWLHEVSSRWAATYYRRRKACIGVSRGRVLAPFRVTESQATMGELTSRWVLAVVGRTQVQHAISRNFWPYRSGGSPSDEGRKSTNVDFAQRSGRAQNLRRCIAEGAARERSTSADLYVHQERIQWQPAELLIRVKMGAVQRTMHAITRKMQSAGSSRRRSSIDADLDARVRCTLVGGRGWRCMQREQGAGAAGVVRRERAVGESGGESLGMLAWKDSAWKLPTQGVCTWSASGGEHVAGVARGASTITLNGRRSGTDPDLDARIQCTPAQLREGALEHGGRPKGAQDISKPTTEVPTREALNVQVMKVAPGNVISRVATVRIQAHEIQTPKSTLVGARDAARVASGEVDNVTHEGQK
ncbi:hypothetical protein C8F04DRAFT_1177341 [Mycena alexandri]|uniref:Uncharacterized protein n=1 Tax=Mycena alexandri TaxID=1745969 RepID=A0AAD6T8K1_9AGAR|nr:hypothetical protein C8F04DRAFT_1177341 [Mycena alexandri]